VLTFPIRTAAAAAPAKLRSRFFAVPCDGFVGLQCLSFPKIRSGRIRAVRENQTILLPWLAAALFNLYLGTQHGYSVVSELPFFAIVFGIPALAALTVMRWARSAASQP
jgi:hypothetical protein